MNNNVFSGCLALACCLLLMSCANRYPGWEHVRVELEKPSTDCEYKIQESCYGVSAKCFNRYKKRAIIFGANTVVLTYVDRGQSSKGSVALLGDKNGAKFSSNPTASSLADYYYCER